MLETGQLEFTNPSNPRLTYIHNEVIETNKWCSDVLGLLKSHNDAGISERSLGTIW